mmetsp:Transcript_60851/g.162899  ORF Transcript_60851/g.162899 Transcript_60851/m.162899 type:complete len:508 (-) Transcript_60851:274-1797(-)
MSPMYPECDDEDLAPAAGRGRSPGPRELATGGADASALLTVPCTPAWIAIARRMQAEELARDAAVRGLEAHMDKAVALLSVRMEEMEEAMQAMQERVAALVEGAAQTVEAGKALADLNGLRQSVLQLEETHARQEEQIQGVDSRLTALRAVQTGGDGEHKAATRRLAADVEDLESRLTSRLDGMEEEHRKLDNAVADIAKLGLVAAQVARQARATPPPRLSQTRTPPPEPSSDGTPITGERALEGSRAPPSATSSSTSLLFGAKQATATADEAAPGVTRQVSPARSNLSTAPSSSGLGILPRKSAPAVATSTTLPASTASVGAAQQARHTVPPLQVPQVTLRAISPQPVQQRAAKEGTALASSSSWGHLSSTPQQGWHRLPWSKAQVPSSTVSPVPATPLPGASSKEPVTVGGTEPRNSDGNRSPCGSLSARIDAPQAQAGAMQSEVRQRVPPGSTVGPLPPNAASNGMLSARRSPRVSSTGAAGTHEVTSNGGPKARYPSPQALWR